MDLRGYLAILAKRSSLIVSVLVLSLAAAAMSILLMTPTYRGQAQLFVSTQVSSGNLNQELFQGGNFSAERVKSYSLLVSSPTVLDPVIKELNLPITAPELAERVTAKVPLESVLIDISATANSPETAAAIANATSYSLAAVIGNLESSETRGTSPVKATVVTPAVAPSSPAFPSIPMNLGIGLIAGLVAGVGMALVLEKLNTSIKNAEDLATVSSLPILAAVPRDIRRDAPAIVRDDHFGGRSEAYRLLRTNLQFAAVGDMPKIIAVTSAQAGEGKSSAAGNLAVALSQVGMSVCLIDADLRRPSLASYFQLTPEVGLSEVLVGRAELNGVLQPVGKGFFVIGSGAIPPNPAELLSSGRFQALMRDLTARFDIVLVDCPPLLPAADAVALAAVADGVVFVVHASKTGRHQVQRALRNLDHVQARVLGVVLNMVPKGLGKSRYWYTSGYNYRSRPAPAKPLSAETVPATTAPPPVPAGQGRTHPEGVDVVMATRRLNGRSGSAEG